MLSWGAAAGLLALLAVSTVGGGAAPIAASRRDKAAGAKSARPGRALELCTHAASGVFLGLAVVHLLPEAADLLGRTGGPDSLAVGPAIAAAAFLALVAAETVGAMRAAGLRRPGGDALLLDEDLEAGRASGYGSGGDSAAAVGDTGAGGKEAKKAPEEETPSPTAAASRGGAVAMLAAASVHAVLEGAVLGVQRDTRAFLTMYIAIFLHKWAVSASLAARLVAHYGGAGTRVYLAVAAFSLCSPAGAAVALSALHDLSSGVLGTVNAVAAGVFLFAAVHERPGADWRGTLLYAAGTTLVAVSQLVAL